MLSERIARVRANLMYLPRALGLVWHAARKWTVVWFVLLTLQGVLPIATLYLTRDLVNQVVALIDAPTPENLQRTLLIVLVFGVLLLVSQVLSGLSNWVRTAQSQLVITHRFTTAMQADVIHVMDCGRIVESGTHTELLASNGRYAQSWQTQMHAG